MIIPKERIKKLPKVEIPLRNKLATYGTSFFDMKVCDIDSLLQTYDLNWKVEKRPLYVLDESGNKIQVENCFGITKTYIDKSGNLKDKVLGLAKKDYRVSQNTDLISIVKPLLNANKNLKIASAGEFNDGKLVYIQIKLENLDILGDKIETYLTILSSNDCTKKIQVCLLHDRIHCHNVFLRPLGENAIKISHTKNIDKRIYDVQKTLDIIQKSQNDLIILYKKMIKIKVTDVTISKITDHFLNIKKGNELSTRKKNLKEAFNECVIKEYTSHKNCDHTLYGIWNAIVCFSNHHSLDLYSSHIRKEYVMIGGGFKEINRAWDYLRKEFLA